MGVSVPLVELSIKNAVISTMAILGLNSNAKSVENKVFFKKDLYIKKEVIKI
jgi:hypothetical protein